MRIKKSYQRKNMNDKKNNFVEKHRVEEQSWQSTIKVESDLELTCNSTVNSVNEEEKENQLPEMVYSTVTEETILDLSKKKTCYVLPTQEAAVVRPQGEVSLDLTTQEAVVAPTTSNSITNNNENIYLGTVGSNRRGKKRYFQETLDVNDNETSDGSINGALDIGYMDLKKKCIEMEEQIKVFEEQYIQRPKDANVVRYLVDLGNKLGTVKRDQPDVHKCMVDLLNTIGINKNDIKNLKKPTPTSVARQLIKMKYPNPDPYQGFSQADKTVVKAIIKYVQYCYPYATASATDIRRAMNNYFSAVTYKANHSNGC